MPIFWWKRRKARQVAAALGEGDRFCKDCKWCHPKVHFFIFRGYEFAKCASPIWVKFSITKEEQARYYIDGLKAAPHAREERFCSTMRQDGYGYCGPKGEGWEPK